MMCDRYFKVMNPSKHGNMSARCLFFLNFMWFFSAAYNIWQIITNTSYRFDLQDEDQNITVRKCLAALHYPIIKITFLVTDYIFFYLLPFIVLVYLFVCICMKVCSHNERHVTTNSRFILAISLTILFYICQLPLEIMQTILYLTDNLSTYTLSLLQILESLSFSHGMFHAAAYACCGHEASLACGVQRQRRFTRDESCSSHPAPERLLTSQSQEGIAEATIETTEI